MELIIYIIGLVYEEWPLKHLCMLLMLTTGCIKSDNGD